MRPLGILIKPASSLCNMRCAYCFYADVADHRQVKSFGIMDEDTLETLIEKALKYAAGQCSFMFQGGEPTLAGLDFFRKAVALQEKHNINKVKISNSLQTNGLVIDDEWAAFLGANRFLVGLSMDGDKAMHDGLRVDGKKEGTFARVQKAARFLQKHGCEFNVLCVITSFTAKHAQKVYNSLKEYRYLQFIPCIEGFDGKKSPYVLTDEAYGNFLNATFEMYYRDYMAGNYVSIRQFDNMIHMLLGRPPENCAMQGTCTCNLVIEGDGSAYPCDFYVLDEYHLGNIKEDEIPAMLRGERAHEFVHKSEEMQLECKGCKWVSLCRGGCRRDREQRLQDPLNLNRFCKGYQMFFEKNIGKLMEIARLEGAQRGQV